MINIPTSDVVLIQGYSQTGQPLNPLAPAQSKLLATCQSELLADGQLCSVTQVVRRGAMDEE